MSRSVDEVAESEGLAIKAADATRPSRPRTYHRAALQAVPAPKSSSRRDRRPIVERLQTPVVPKPVVPDWLTEFIGTSR